MGRCLLSNYTGVYTQNGYSYLRPILLKSRRVMINFLLVNRVFGCKSNDLTWKELLRLIDVVWHHRIDFLILFWTDVHGLVQLSPQKSKCSNRGNWCRLSRWPQTYASAWSYFRGKVPKKTRKRKASFSSNLKC